jgi:hypothetical protein
MTRLAILLVLLACVSCAVGRIHHPDGSTMTALSIGQSRVVSCAPGGQVDSATGALIGPCDEISGGSGSGGFYATLAAAIAGAVAVLGGASLAALL